MIRRILLAVLLTACSASAFARGHYYNYAQKGAGAVSVGGFSSSNKVQKSYPSATYSVYVAGTATLATIYSDAGGTAKANPSTATADGYIDFWTDAATIDITFSGSGITTSCGAAFPGYPCITAFTWSSIQIQPIANPVNAADYGAVADEKIIYDANITSGLTTLTSTSGRFLATDVGKVVYVEGAGPNSFAPLATTIAAFNSVSSVTLTAAAGTTVVNGRAWWGTDNTTALQNWINAAASFTSSANNGDAVLQLGDCIGTFGGYLTTDTLSFPTTLQYATIQGCGQPNISGDLTNGTNLSYHGIELRWAGSETVFAISNATNVTPIVITTTANHGLSNGDLVFIAGVVGNTAANGEFSVANVTPTTFSLKNHNNADGLGTQADIVGNGAYSSGGYVVPLASSKPILWFKDGSYGNVIQRIGFYGGYEGVRIRRNAHDGVGTIARNELIRDYFDNQLVAHVRVGWPYSDHSSNSNDDIDGTLIDRCFFFATGFGATKLRLGTGMAIMSYPDNGHAVTINQAYTVLPGNVRHVWTRALYNFSITNSVFHKTVGTTADGTYALDLSADALGPMSGWTHVDWNHFELPYGLTTKYWTNGVDYGNSISMRGNQFNCQAGCDATASLIAIDVSASGHANGVYAHVEQTRVSTGAIQRAIKFGTGGGSIEIPCPGSATADIITEASGVLVSRLGGCSSFGQIWQWVPVTYNAGNFSSSSGTWSLPGGAANQTVFKYTRVGGAMYVNFMIDSSTITGTPANLLLTLPNGVVTADYLDQPITLFNNGGVLETGEVIAAAGASQLQIFRAARAAFAAGAANNSIYGMIVVPVK